MPMQATLPQRLAARDQRWLRYLADLQEYATVPQPLESVGTRLRVTGLVLEAAGIRVPVGCARSSRTTMATSGACWPKSSASAGIAPS